jgi:type IV secretion system protein VirB4
MNVKKKHDLFNKMREGKDVIPIKAHITPSICLTNKDELVSVIRFDGLMYEELSFDQLETYKNVLNNMFLNLHDPRIGVWQCMLRRSVDVEVNKDLDSEFSRRFAAAYAQNIEGTGYINTYYLAVVYNPLPFGASLNKKKDKSLFRDSIEAGIKVLEDKVQEVIDMLSAYSPYLLSIDKNSRHSEVARFYSDVFYFRPHDVPVTTQNLANGVFDRRVLFGNELIEIRHYSESTYASVLSVKEYGDSTEPDMYLSLLSLPFEFNFIQSFLCIEKHKAKNMLVKQRDVLTSAGDESQSQIDGIKEGLDDLVSGRLSIGEHSLSLVVHAEDKKSLKANINAAATALKEPGNVVVREDMANEAHYLSQLPANRKYRPRPVPITSKNIAAMASMYGVRTGLHNNHHWNKPVMPFIGFASQAYEHAHHVDDVSINLLCGMTGSGKTALMNAWLTMLRRDGIRHVHFDKDEGSKVLINAIGGDYNSFEIGKPTGFNPFSLDNTPINTHYIFGLVKLLVGDTTQTEEDRIVDAIKSVYSLSRKENRRLGSMMNYLYSGEENSIADRLREWTGEERLGWVFDNPTDTLNFNEVTAFDVTNFLTNVEINTPIMSYLLHRIMPLIDGNPLCIWIDEFWMLLKNEYFKTTFLEDQLRTIRKNNGSLILATQSPADALRSDISRALIEQCSTKIFLPNEQGTKSDYVDGFKLSPSLWDHFKSLTKSSRQFLVQTGELAVFATMPLYGMKDELNILSGRKQNNKIFDSLRNENNDLPDNWMDLYLKSINQRDALK